MIQPVTPQAGSTVRPGKDNSVWVAVQLSLSCGCPVCAGGRWDASRFRVKAELMGDTGVRGVCSATLKCTGNTGEFGGVLRLPAHRAEKKMERAMLKFEASDPETGMAGRCHINIKLSC